MPFTNRLIFFLVLCVIVLSSLFPFQYYGAGVNVYVGMVLLALAGITFVINRNAQRFDKKVKFVLFAFVVFWFLSSLSASNIQLSFVRFFYYGFTGLTVFYILFNTVKDVEYAGYFNLLLLALCVVVSVYGIVEFVTKKNILYAHLFDRENFLYFKLLRHGSGYSDSGRIVSTVGHPVTLGFFLVPGILLIAHRFLMRQTVLHILILVIVITGLLFTFTRGSWIAVGIPFLLLLFKKKAVILKFGAIAVLLLGALIFFSGEVRNSLLTRIPMSYIQNPVERNRIGSYLTVSKILAEHPLFGVGTANFRFKRFEYDEFPTVIEGPDNLYLMILAENGILGFVTPIVKGNPSKMCATALEQCS